MELWRRPSSHFQLSGVYFRSRSLCFKTCISLRLCIELSGAGDHVPDAKLSPRPVLIQNSSFLANRLVENRVPVDSHKPKALLLTERFCEVKMKVGLNRIGLCCRAPPSITKIERSFRIYLPSPHRFCPFEGVVMMLKSRVELVFVKNREPMLSS